MTCIVGIVEDGKVYIGADSMSARDWNSDITMLRKVFRVGQFVIGYTDSFRMGQILQYHLEVPHQQDGVTDERYMVVEFVEAVRMCLKEKGYAHVENNEESGGAFLVGYRGCLYEVYADFQVNRSTRNIAALGCGYAYALGVIHALPLLSPLDRIRKALEITAQLSNGVCAPFHIETLE